MTKITKTLSILLLVLGTITTNAQTLYDVVLGTDNVPITEVQIEFNGATITQTSGGIDPTIPANETTLPVWMNYVKINDGGVIKTLDFLNAKGALLASNNFTNATTGVGVYNEGVETLISNGVAAWEDAMQDMVTSRNALSYMFYDGSSNTPPADDFDIYWSKALTNDDYLVVSERDGNTFFRIVPLDINGNPITSARELRFGKQNGIASSNGNKKYDWNIGYGSAGRFANQPQYFTVVDVNLFNTIQPIYGFRIDNNGDADVKFYGISDDTFENNPTNPLVPGIEGNVFNDLDKLTDNTVDGAGISTPSGTQLYASLVDSSNTIVDTVPINSDGSYAFLDDIEPNSNYTVVLHTNPNGSKVPNLPATWTNTGENQGTTPGDDGNVNGILAVSVGTVTETEVNFGIEKLAVVCSGSFDAQLNGTNGTPDLYSPYVSGTATYPSPLQISEMSPVSVPASGYRGFDEDYSVVVGGNFVIPASGGAETEGRVAVGGDFISNKTGSIYGVSQSGGGTFVIGAPGSYGLAVNGDIQINGTAANDRIQIGFNAHPASYTAIAGGAINNPSKIEVTNQISGTPTGVDVTGILSDMAIVSSEMSTSIATGSLTDLGGGVRELAGGNNDMEIFHLDGTANQDLDPGYVGILKFKEGTIKSGATIVINVSGTSVVSRLQALAGRVNDPVSSAAGSDLDALVYHVIWNFYEASDVSILSDLNGSMIAPSADLDVKASINGRVYSGGNLIHSGSGSEIHNFPFTGDLSVFCTSSCEQAENNTLTVTIDEGQTKTLVGSPAGGVWSVVAGGGTINAGVYTPDDINANTDVTIRYTLATDGSCAASTADVTFTVTAIQGSIGDTVWYDADGNGAQNGSELGLEGATVTLDSGTPSNTADDVTTTTDANGNYLFENLPAGDYTVSVDVSTVTGGLPVGVTVTELSQTYDNDGTGTADTSDVTLGAGENNLDQDFGYQGLGSIGDTVWYDADGNGTQNGSEVGLEGATVTLDPGTPGNAGDDVTTTTDANGNYLFENLQSGNYTVSVDVSTVTVGLPVGVTAAELSQTYDNDGTSTESASDVVLGAGENNLDQDFGYYQELGSIGDTVWYDADENGAQNGSELGLEGATVTLDPGTPGNAGDDVTTTTDASGEYLFENLPAGNYTVSVDVSTVTGGLPAGITENELSVTFDADGIDTSSRSDVTLAIAEDNVDQDFGYVAPECLSDDCKVTTFEHYLVNKGWDLDGIVNGVIVPAPEVDTIKYLDVSGKNLRDLIGIEYFTSLETLIANENEITVLDLIQNVNLKHVSLKYNDIIGINVRDNINLCELYLEGNKLTEIDLSNNLVLKKLGLRYNEIKHLDVSNNSLLELLEVNYNKLEQLLLGTNCNLEYLNAGYNNLDVIDLDGIKCIVTLLLNDNNLSGTLDLSDHIKIELLNLCNNNLDNYPPGSCDTVQQVPVCFETLEEYMVDKGLDLDGVTNGSIIPAPEVATMTYLNLTGLCIKDMTGIEFFTSLTELHIAGNLVTTIDLSNNTLLRVLDISGNKLESLDLSNQVILEELYAGTNCLTTIDLSNNLLLRTLSLKGNKLTSLDLTPNEALVYVEVQGNVLEELILGYKKMLTHLYAGTNKLTTLDVRAALNLAVLSLEYNNLEGTLDLDNNKCIVKLNLSNNQLEKVLFGNGYNNIVSNDNFNILNNPNLTCVKVDNVSYSTFNWTTYVEDSSVFTEFDDCSDGFAPVVVNPNEIEIVNNEIVVPADVVQIKIFTQSGRTVVNTNLHGVYFVMMVNANGEVNVSKILVL
ncbi:SdrD B-like domain-containing protein [Wenyingzhuangia sp. 2_MG-2023]|uniref:SdrD B-like domain-containing protein n=1 Tax=Wenyingzhuangia sp. 2_MG-2023 TaxID=3062639 RepID=UPI0026E227F8|nr:SdrD B-like domain-containing protein [Wenyingzhuangia sp. 2_MG-2023]MDO6737735.1 SdrD B-like domain-containing protein [Wenyingzhuangia sp. 2_MG-2023]